MYSAGCKYCGGYLEVLFSYEYLCRCGGKQPPPTEEDVKRIIKENKEIKI